MKHLYIVYGWVNTEVSVEIGTFETDMNIKESWDFITQIFDDGVSYPEGLYAKDAH